KTRFALPTARMSNSRWLTAGPSPHSTLWGAAPRGFGRAIDITAWSVSFSDVMKMLLRKTLAVAVVGLSVTSYAYSQQRSPKDILPPTPDKPPVSPALTVITPSNVGEISPNRITVTPLAPAAPLQSTPGLTQPGVV